MGLLWNHCFILSVDVITISKIILIALKLHADIASQISRMDRNWFEDINTIANNCRHLDESMYTNKRNVRYTPSEKSHSKSNPQYMLKRSYKAHQKNKLSISVVTRDSDRSVCLINQDEVDRFVNLICEFGLFCSFVFCKVIDPIISKFLQFDKCFRYADKVSLPIFSFIYSIYWR